jgi:hypothetical protein
MDFNMKDFLLHPKKYYNYLKIDRTLEGFFLRSLIHQFNFPKGVYPFGNYYEFGVGKGNSLIQYLKAASVFCKNYKVQSDELKIFAFDSFEGLPKSEVKEDKHQLWSEGDFSCSKQDIKKIISNLNLENTPEITYIEGFFENSLTDSLKQKMIQSPPAIITIDVDYYTSTKTILNWLRPVLPSGSIFYFDDIWPFHGNPDYGELKAINEFNKENLGYLTPFPILGMISQAYIYSKKIL